MFSLSNLLLVLGCVIILGLALVALALAIAMFRIIWHSTKNTIENMKKESEQKDDDKML